jgi:hypothetical protein
MTCDFDPLWVEIRLSAPLRKKLLRPINRNLGSKKAEDRLPPSSTMEDALDREIGDQLFQRAHLPAQAFDLPRRSLALCIACQPLLAGLQELLGSHIIQAIRDRLPPAQFGGRVLATQPRDHDPNFLF